MFCEIGRGARKLAQIFTDISFFVFFCVTNQSSCTNIVTSIKNQGQKVFSFLGQFLYLIHLLYSAARCLLCRIEMSTRNMFIECFIEFCGVELAAKGDS